MWRRVHVQHFLLWPQADVHLGTLKHQHNVSMKPSSVSKHKTNIQKNIHVLPFWLLKMLQWRRRKSAWSNVQIHCIRFTLCSSLRQRSLTWDKGSLERTRKGHHLSYIRGTVSKAMLGKLLRVTMDIMWAFLTTQIPSWDEPDWTALKSLLCHTKTKISYLRQVRLTWDKGILPMTWVSYQKQGRLT